MRNLLHLLRACSAVVWTIAAAASLNAASSAALAADRPAGVARAEKPSGQGTLNAIDAAKRQLNITHGPIAALDWPGMTMDFGVAPGVDLTALKAGSKISFTLSRDADGMYVIDAVEPTR